jgi:RES domain-containing protein
MAWRLDQASFAASWDSGEGAYRVGGRWNRKGVRAVYCSVDPAAAILEVAVHKGFTALDAIPHVLTAVKSLTPPPFISSIRHRSPMRTGCARAFPVPGSRRLGMPCSRRTRSC